MFDVVRYPDTINHQCRWRHFSRSSSATSSKVTASDALFTSSSESSMTFGLRNKKGPETPSFFFFFFSSFLLHSSLLLHTLFHTQPCLSSPPASSAPPTPSSTASSSVTFSLTFLVLPSQKTRTRLFTHSSSH